MRSLLVIVVEMCPASAFVLHPRAAFKAPGLIIITKKSSAAVEVAAVALFALRSPWMLMLFRQ